MTPLSTLQGAITSFLEGTVRGLQADQPHPVRISAVRAIWGFCHHLRGARGEQESPRRQLLVPLLPALVDGLVAMASNFSHSSEILGLILENLAVVLACDNKFTAEQEAKVSPLAIAIFLKYNSDPVITSLSQDIFKVLSQNPACAGPLQVLLLIFMFSRFQFSSFPRLMPVLPDSFGPPSSLHPKRLRRQVWSERPGSGCPLLPGEGVPQAAE